MIGLSACMLLSGCGNAIPELTEVQQNMITEYAVGTVLKYSANYDDKIIRKELEKTEMVESEEMTEEQLENEDAKNDEVQVSEETTEETTEESTEVPVVSSNEMESTQSLDEFLGLEGFKVEFQGSEICDAYSDTENEAIAFELKASEGNKLLVLKYAVTNVTEQEQRFDMLAHDAKAKISVAGNNKSALLTMLENDFLHADMMIGANETKTFVILTEIKVDVEVGEVTLTLMKDGEKIKYNY